jgi:hypothetical protein
MLASIIILYRFLCSARKYFIDFMVCTPNLICKSALLQLLHSFAASKHNKRKNLITSYYIHSLHHFSLFMAIQTQVTVVFYGYRTCLY